MSDYLARLVERSLGAVSQIEPLISPLHAPAEQALTAEAEPQPIVAIAPAPTATSVAASDIEVTSGKTVVADVNAGTAATALTAAEQRPARPAELPVQSSVARRGESPEPPPQIPKRAEPAPHPPMPQPAISLPFTAAVPAPPAPPIASREKQDRVEVRPANTATAPIAGRLDEPSSIVDPIASATSAADLPTKVTKTTQTPNRVVVQPEIMPPRQPPAFLAISPQPSRATGPPAIHVTIGRVEVRAVHPPPEPPRPPAPPPATRRISLEEYLKRRNGARS